MDKPGYLCPDRLAAVRVIAHSISEELFPQLASLLPQELIEVSLRILRERPARFHTLLWACVLSNTLSKLLNSKLEENELLSCWNEVCPKASSFFSDLDWGHCATFGAKGEVEPAEEPVLYYCLDHLRNAVNAFSALANKCHALSEATRALMAAHRAAKPGVFLPFWFHIERNIHELRKHGAPQRFSRSFPQTDIDFLLYGECPSALYDDVVGYLYYSLLNAMEEQNYRLAFSNLIYLTRVLYINQDLRVLRSEEDFDMRRDRLFFLPKIESVFFAERKSSALDRNALREALREDDSKRGVRDPRGSSYGDTRADELVTKLLYNQNAFRYETVLGPMIALSFYLYFSNWDDLDASYDESDQVSPKSHGIFVAVLDKVRKAKPTNDYSRALCKVVSALSKRDVCDLLAVLDAEKAVLTRLQPAMEDALRLLVTNQIRGFFGNGLVSHISKDHALALFANLDLQSERLLASFLGNKELPGNTKDLWRILGDEQTGEWGVIGQYLENCGCEVTADGVYWRRLSKHFNVDRLGEIAMELAENNVRMVS